MRLTEILKLLLQSVIDLVRPMPRSVKDVQRRMSAIRALLMSCMAMHLRQTGHRTVLLIGLGFSVYAAGLFLTDRITKDQPPASHDVILKTRWSSPTPASNIIIVDIDERSLATLAPEHGRWPWSRSVLADGVQKLSDIGMKALLLNVLMSDPDKNSPDSDGAMEVTAAIIRPVSFPVIRLNPQNDAKSQMTVAQLLQKTGDTADNGSATVAVILPLFESMLDRIGVANQEPDDDGAVRRYPVIWSDGTLTMPSIVARTAQLAGLNVNSVPPKITLNWRNKKGRYTRVSFSDLLKAKEGDPALKVFKDAVVVMGVSAPGLGQTKGTSVRAVEDDNEILATALDDVINETYLRVLPAWATLLLELAAIWTLVWIAMGGALSPILTKAFLIFESGLGSITMVGASYTNYLLDFSGCMAFGAGVFISLKFVQILDSGWSRARPGLRRAARVQDGGVIVMLGYRDSQVSRAEAAALQRFLEGEVGIQHTIRVDDLFGGESFIRPTLEDFTCQLCLLPFDAEAALRRRIERQPVFDRLHIQRQPLQTRWDPDDVSFRKEIAPWLLRMCAEVIEGPVAEAKA